MNLKDMARPGRQLVGGRRGLVKRSLDWRADEAVVTERQQQQGETGDEDVEEVEEEEEEQAEPAAYEAPVVQDPEKALLLSRADELAVDLETDEAELAGLSRVGGGELTRRAATVGSVLPAAAARWAAELLQRVQASPAYVRMKPVVDFLARVVMASLSLPLQAFLSRLCMALVVVLFYFFAGPLHGAAQPRPTE